MLDVPVLRDIQSPCPTDTPCIPLQPGAPATARVVALLISVDRPPPSAAADRPAAKPSPDPLARRCKLDPNLKAPGFKGSQPNKRETCFQLETWLLSLRHYTLGPRMYLKRSLDGRAPQPAPDWSRQGFNHNHNSRVYQYMPCKQFRCIVYYRQGFNHNHNSIVCRYMSCTHNAVVSYRRTTRVQSYSVDQ